MLVMLLDRQTPRHEGVAHVAVEAEIARFRGLQLGRRPRRPGAEDDPVRIGDGKRDGRGIAVARQRQLRVDEEEFAPAAAHPRLGQDRLDRPCVEREIQPRRAAGGTLEPQQEVGRQPVLLGGGRELHDFATQQLGAEPRETNETRRDDLGRCTTPLGTPVPAVVLLGHAAVGEVGL